MLNKKSPGLINNIASNINGLSKKIEMGFIDNKKTNVVNKLEIETIVMPLPTIDRIASVSLTLDDIALNTEKFIPAEPIMENIIYKVKT